jgi:hypothetical protein
MKGRTSDVYREDDFVNKIINGQSRETDNIGQKQHKMKTNKTKIQPTMCWKPLDVNANNINKTRALLHTTGGKYEPK